jgi:CheY-like chemotaxis protein
MRPGNPRPVISASGARRARRLLVVEDECLIALNLVEQLAALGYLVIGPAITMAEARHLAAVAAFDVAVVDLKLQGVFTMAAILIRRQIPFLFVTGYSEVPDRQRYKNVAVLTRPVRAFDLQRAVEEAGGA